MNKICKCFVGSAAMIALTTTAWAGEITGNGKEITVNGQSSCAFSGQNDTPFGDEATADPGGRVQSYGFFYSQTWLHDFLDPAFNDPRFESLSPGWACNPNRGGAFDPGG